MLFRSKYSFELWTRGGELIADLGGLARNRQVTMSRNEAETINFTLELNEFESYCNDIGISSTSLITSGVTEVRVRRIDKYLCGGLIFYAQPRINARTQTFEVRAHGFLNMFDKRYTGSWPSGFVQEDWLATEGSSIAVGLITQSQALTNGNLGITFGVQATAGVHDRIYSRSKIKTAIQNFGSLETRPFDHKFSHDKVFSTYNRIGSYRPEIVFEFPKNITDIAAPIDARLVANEVTAAGSGTGEYGQVTVQRYNSDSQLSYGLQQNVVLSNGTDDSDHGITDDAEKAIAAYKAPFQVPELVIDGNQAPFVTDYGIGDIVKVKIGKYDTLSNVNGSYRIEKIDLRIDEDDNEAITLSVVTV